MVALGHRLWPRLDHRTLLRDRSHWQNIVHVEAVRLPSLGEA